MPEKGILLVNLGTPDSTEVKDVRRYLREFLMDKRVIDIPVISRWLLVNVIIATFRAPKSAAEYRKLFTDRGSPLKFYTEDLVKIIRERVPDIRIEYAMRYQNPSLDQVLEKFRRSNVRQLHVIPLFPQYASATTGSVIDKVMEIIRKWQVIPSVRFTSQFFDHPLFLSAEEALGRKLMDQTRYDHFVFSYHGLPERQIHKASFNGYCKLGTCCNSLTKANQFCYRAQCFETTRLIAENLSIPAEKYTVCFQSRLGKDPWIKPYTEEVLRELPQKGVKKVLAFSPAFVADCLETTIEVGETYRDDFIKAGGERWDLVPSLNVEDKWVDCLIDIATSQ